MTVAKARESDSAWKDTREHDKAPAEAWNSRVDWKVAPRASINMDQFTGVILVSYSIFQ